MDAGCEMQDARCRRVTRGDNVREEGRGKREEGGRPSVRARNNRSAVKRVKSREELDVSTKAQQAAAAGRAEWVG